MARTRGIDYHAAARGRRETTLVLGDDLRLRLLPTPRSPEDCLDPGSSARLTDAAEAEGSSIIHLHEDTWRRRGAIVRDRLLNRVQATQRVYARKTTARPIAAEEAIAFLDEHHLWGPTNAKYAYGLFLQDELVAVATFTKRKLVKRGSGSSGGRTSSCGSARGGTCGWLAASRNCCRPSGRIGTSTTS